MVGYPRDVEEVFTGPDGIFVHARPGTLAVDMTTSSPALAQRLYELGQEKGIRVMDAPVSGGDSGARNATLSIMAGGDAADFEEAAPLFACMGKSIHHMGPAGCGQHTKAANQIAMGPGATAGLLPEGVGLRQTGRSGPPRHAQRHWRRRGRLLADHQYGPPGAEGDFAPGFFIKHFIKDMHIIQEECRSRKVELEMLDKVCSLYESLAEDGLEDEGTQALIRYYQD